MHKVTEEVSADGQSSTLHYGGTVSITLEHQIDRALMLMKGDPKAAGNLLMRWAETDSEIRSLIPDVIADYITKRVKARSKAVK